MSWPYFRRTQALVRLLQALGGFSSVKTQLDSAANETTFRNHEYGRQPLAVKSADRKLTNYLMTMAYDGSEYFGWQCQPDLPTVQEAVEKSLAKVLGLPSIKVFSSSRTDTGVHAIGQAVVFSTNKWPTLPDKLPFALNTELPRSIVARTCQEVPPGFHPLRNSTGKRYRYFVYGSRKADPIHARTHWWVRRRLNLQQMQEAAERLIGEHDFTSFQTTGSPRSSTVRHVRSLTITQTEHMDGSLFAFDIEANGFLYNMVRNIVGTLVQVGVGREKPAWISQVLEAKDRTVAGATAPPQGLFLVEVLF